MRLPLRNFAVMQRTSNRAELQIAPRPGIALALGGGFARGFAHLGVLRVLEQNHIPISHIAGTSVGSVFGAAYASGAPLARILATSRTIRFRDIARWSVSRLGLASNHRLADLIERVFDSTQFEDMKIPLAVVATDLATGDPVVFRQGPLVEAIRVLPRAIGRMTKQETLAEPCSGSSPRGSATGLDNFPPSAGEAFQVLQ